MNLKVLSKLINQVADQIDGDWVVIGGMVLPLLGDEYRVTVDVDLVSTEEKASQERTLQLMQIAQDAGLPIETINSAGGFFLYRIKGWKNDLVLLKKGKRGRIFRPNATLYLILKIGRMSETDLEDCKKMIRFAQKQNEPIDFKRVRLEISLLNGGKSTETAKRLRSELDVLLSVKPSKKAGSKST